MYDLIHGNCIDVLRTMPDKSVDCIVTDPPYIVGAKGCGLAGNRQYLADISAAGLDAGFDHSVLDEFIRVLNPLAPDLPVHASTPRSSGDQTAH